MVPEGVSYLAAEISVGIVRELLFRRKEFNLMKDGDFTAHLMVLQGRTWYTVSTTPLHYSAMQMPFSPGSMNPLPPNTEEEETA